MTFQLSERQYMKNRKRPYNRSRTSEKQEFRGCTACCFGFLTLVLEILLCGSLGLVLFWVIHYRGGFAWHEDLPKQFNYHPVLMVGGFVFLMGQAMLVYRVCRCCRRIYNKLWHTILHLLAMPAIAIAAVAVFDFHTRSNPPIPDLYSMHSWMGLVTIGLFCLQFIVGFFSFLVLLCCDSATANYRAALQPIHVHFGLATFIMAIATCVTGLTEKVLFTYDVAHKGSRTYSGRPEEAWVINALCMTLIAAGLLMTFVIRYHRFQRGNSITISERL